jgi:hypothetical protein
METGYPGIRTRFYASQVMRESLGQERDLAVAADRHYLESVVDPEPDVVGDGARVASLSIVFGRPNITIATTTANATKPTAHGMNGLARSF